MQKVKFSVPVIYLIFHKLWVNADRDVHLKQTSKQEVHFVNFD